MIWRLYCSLLDILLFSLLATKFFFFFSFLIHLPILQPAAADLTAAN